MRREMREETHLEVTVERLLLALAMDASSDAGRVLGNAGVTPTSLNAAINEIRKGRTADSASAEQAYDALKRYARDLTAAAAEGTEQGVAEDAPAAGPEVRLGPPHP